MRKYLFWFAVVGWTLGLTVHVLSLANVDITEKFPLIWMLHISIFVVWIPVVLKLKNTNESRQIQKSTLFTRTNQTEIFKTVFKDAPAWLVTIAIIGFFYAIINFMLFAFSQPGNPDTRNGQYVLQNHGQVIKTITEQEYHHYKANEVRGFSGHWIAFYGIAMAGLFPFKKKSKSL